MGAYDGSQQLRVVLPLFKGVSDVNEVDIVIQRLLQIQLNMGELLTSWCSHHLGLHPQSLHQVLPHLVLINVYTEF